MPYFLGTIAQEDNDPNHTILVFMKAYRVACDSSSGFVLDEFVLEQNDLTLSGKVMLTKSTQSELSYRKTALFDTKELAGAAKNQIEALEDRKNRKDKTGLPPIRIFEVIPETESLSNTLSFYTWKGSRLVEISYEACIEAAE